MKHSMTARARVLMLLSATAIVACTPGGEGGARTSPTGNTPPGDGLSDGGAESEAPASPAVFEVDGDPNGLFWSANEGVLYVADDDGNRILSFVDGAFRPFATLPAAPSSGPGLGQIVRRTDGSLVVPRFGHGTAGDVVVVAPDGNARALTKLDRQRRRIGLAEAPDARLFVGFFAGDKGTRVGSIAELDVTSETETIVATDFKKPVGVIADTEGLLVADQDVSEIVRVPFADPTARTLVARIPSPDLMTWGEGGSFYVGSKEGYVSHVLADGTVERLPASLREVRGVAVDATTRRLFAIDHDTQSDEARHYLHVLPLDE